MYFLKDLRTRLDSEFLVPPNSSILGHKIRPLYRHSVSVGCHTIFTFDFHQTTKISHSGFHHPSLSNDHFRFSPPRGSFGVTFENELGDPPRLSDFSKFTVLPTVPIETRNTHLVINDIFDTNRVLCPVFWWIFRQKSSNPLSTFTGTTIPTVLRVSTLFI